MLIIGAGPIIIGQACEFDYSGTQACKALREEGFRVILVNSNPATIMTDPEFADHTYIEPITPESVAKIIRKEQAWMQEQGMQGKLVLLPTLGGQTALNVAMDMHRSGQLVELGIELIGAQPDAIEKGEDRLAFKEAMKKIGLDVPGQWCGPRLAGSQSHRRKHRPFSFNHSSGLHPRWHRWGYCLQLGRIRNHFQARL